MKYKDLGENRRFERYDGHRRRKWDEMRAQPKESRTQPPKPAPEIESEKRGGTILAWVVVACLVIYLLNAFLPRG